MHGDDGDDGDDGNYETRELLYDCRTLSGTELLVRTVLNDVVRCPRLQEGEKYLFTTIQQLTLLSCSCTTRSPLAIEGISIFFVIERVHKKVSSTYKYLQIFFIRYFYFPTSITAPGRQWNGEENLAIFLFQSRMKKLICDS